MKDDLEIIDLDKELNSIQNASSNNMPKEDLTVTRAQAKVEELEKELARLKAAKAARGNNPELTNTEAVPAEETSSVKQAAPSPQAVVPSQEIPTQENNMSQMSAGDMPAEAVTGEGKRRVKTNAEAYASSEKNVADMLAEYDAIANDDRPVRRSERRMQKNSADRPVDQRSRTPEAHRSVEERKMHKASEEHKVTEAHKPAEAHKAKTHKPGEAHRPVEEQKAHRAVEAHKPTEERKMSEVHKTAEAHKAHKPTEAHRPAEEHKAHKPAETHKVPESHKAHKNAEEHNIHKASDTRSHEGKKNHAEVRSEKAKNTRGKKGTASGNRKKQQGGGFFSRLTGMDYIIAATGVLILVVAILTVNIYSSVRMKEEQIASFASIGENMAGIGIAGEGALLAMADSKEEETIVIEETEEYTVAEYDEKEDESDEKVTVKLKLQTVVKDLKIKFVNQKTGKLIPGVAFEVEITDSGKKTIKKTDDDKDGIIYIKEITPGEAKVKLLPLEGKDKYSLPTDIQTIMIKESPDYKKIDVSDEIKTEAQVNAATEDTAQATVTESALTDTVAWVESTKTPLDGSMGYDVVERDKLDSVPDEVKNGQPGTASATFTDKVRQFALRAEMLFSNISDLWTIRAYAEEVETTTEEGSTENEKPSSENPSDNPEPSTEAENKSDDGSIDWDKYLTVNGIVVFLDKECTTKATYKDYQSHSEFYLKNGTTGSTGGFKYTGWQTIDGQTYFFDADGNKVTGEQVIQGAKYNFGSDGALKTGSGVLGIDVSKWNGSIDWSRVKNSGISYVIIRCGYRGSTTGALIEDPTFRTNIKGAQAAGLKVGVYFFTQATNEVEAVEEASMTLNLISGYKLSYPVFLDVEASGGRGDKIDAGTRTKVINAYCQTIRNSGYSAGVYANRTWLSEKFSPGSLSGCKIWLAQYAEKPTYGGSYQIWQYSSKGNVSGIKGNVDMNLSYMN